MRNFKLLCQRLASTALVIAASATGLNAIANPADTVLTNAKFYTVDKQKIWAEAVAIDDGNIVFVGSSEGAQAYVGQQTEVVDLKGKFAMPSFIDTHMHPSANAFAMLFTAPLFEAYSHDEYINIIREFAEAHPDHTGIMGSGFDRALYGEEGPRKEDLDAIDSTRPIAVISLDIHSMWVNSKTLELLGITKDTPNPDGGVIKKDPITGEPTGLLIDYAAYNPAWELMPLPTLEEYKTGLVWLQAKLNAYGITSAHDAWGEMYDNYYYDAYDELAKEGKLTVRYRISAYIDPEFYQTQISKGINLAKKYKHPHFKAHSFKFLADAVLEEDTALLLEPYAHKPDYYGPHLWADKDLAAAFTKVDRAGYQIHAHVIGDGGTRVAVQALEAAVQSNGARDSRHSLAHVQLATSEDIVKMGELGLSAHMSPYWMTIDDYYWGFYLPHLGLERASNTYPHQSLFDAGVNVTIGSDWSLSEPDYMHAIYSGMTRVMPRSLFLQGGRNSPGAHYTTDPDAVLSEGDVGPLPPVSERVSLENMLQAATINGAIANFLDDQVGSIEVGKKADIVVLNRNLFNISTNMIPSTKVDMTYFEGKLVYERH